MLIGDKQNFAIEIEIKDIVDAYANAIKLVSNNGLTEGIAQCHF